MNKQSAQSQPSKPAVKVQNLSKKPAKPVKKKSTATAPDKNQQSGKAPRLQVTRSTQTQTQDLNQSLPPELSPWLGDLEPGSPQPSSANPASPLGVESLDDSDLQSQRASSVSVVYMSGDNSILSKRTETVSDPRYRRLLKQRNADPETVSPDPWEYIQRIKADLLAPENFPLPPSRLKVLRQFMEDFLRDTQGYDLADETEDWMVEFDGFRTQLHEALSESRILTVTQAEFKADKEISRNSSEHILQRTLMMSALDRWHLKPVFRYNCEQVWAKTTPFRLPTRGDQLPASKPDLAMYFSADEIRKEFGEVYLPKNHKDLEYCYAPDKDDNRWFPFLFIETKKSDTSTASAKYRNMHHASQALYNIYQCLRDTIHLDKFSKVRTFSIMLTPDRIEARVHRAEESQALGAAWKFCYDEIYESSAYTRDSVARLLQTILNGYATDILLPILRDTYRELVYLNPDNDDLPKRPGDLPNTAASGAPSNGSATEEDTDQSQPGDDVMLSQDPAQSMLPGAHSVNDSSQGSAAEGSKRKGNGNYYGGGAKRMR